MIISLDYDESYTRDPILWDAFIFSARQRGHTVYCVTARDEKYGGQEVKDALQHLVDGIYFTNGQQKEAYMFRQGINIQVWIDDNPYAITRLASASFADNSHEFD